MMQSPLRIEVPDRVHAESLLGHLQAYDAETFQAADGRWNVRIELYASNRLVAALNALEQWLRSANVPFVCVHVDANSYTLHAPASNGAAASPKGSRRGARETAAAPPSA